MNLVSYLEQQFPAEYKRQGQNLRSTVHSSLVVFCNSNRYFRFSREEGGNAVDLLQLYHDYSYADAVAVSKSLDREKPDEAITYEKPKAQPYDTSHDGLLHETAVGNQRVKKWLLDERCIPADVSQYLMDKKLLYGNAVSSAVFVNKERTRFIVKPFKTSTQAPREYGTDFLAPWCFKALGGGTDVFICESPIDAISLYLLLGRKAGYYYAMGGLKQNALKSIYLEQESHTKKNIAVDWDNAGKQFVRKNRKEYDYILPVMDAACLPDGTKDWSDLWQLYCRDEKYRRTFDTHKSDF